AGGLRSVDVLSAILGLRSGLDISNGVKFRFVGLSYRLSPPEQSSKTSSVTLAGEDSTSSIESVRLLSS
ncbi:hypothetical protein H4S04_007526, partial [Coemansia sp. S16]